MVLQIQVSNKTFVGCVVEAVDHAWDVMELSTVVWSGISVVSVQGMVLRALL